MFHLLFQQSLEMEFPGKGVRFGQLKALGDHVEGHFGDPPPAGTTDTAMKLRECWEVERMVGLGFPYIWDTWFYFAGPTECHTPYNLIC